MSRPTKQLKAQPSGSGRGVATDTQGGYFLNPGSLLSAQGVARLCQLALGSAIVSLVVHYTRHTAAPYGWLCMAVWSFCLAATPGDIRAGRHAAPRLPVRLLGRPDRRPRRRGDPAAARRLRALPRLLPAPRMLLGGVAGRGRIAWRSPSAPAPAAWPTPPRSSCPGPIGAGRRPTWPRAPGLLKVAQACAGRRDLRRPGQRERVLPPRPPPATASPVYAVCFVATRGGNRHDRFRQDGHCRPPGPAASRWTAPWRSTPSWPTPALPQRRRGLARLLLRQGSTACPPGTPAARDGEGEGGPGRRCASPCWMPTSRLGSPGTGTRLDVLEKLRPLLLRRPGRGRGPRYGQNANIRYSIDPQVGPRGPVSHRPDNGLITTAVELDREQEQWHNITVIATQRDSPGQVSG
ncbi:hypothetical protein SKAU_G00076840 [Synaphobranchus kaupii]|uniref:Cadherin domain-containing protein n=1 Tax=Synaphobranchus kaupii TaxID=118154 RepID=A0A9Q1G7V1_SYNKA|nr:hypothetical protein SKAU_G00076840 [Synaphobranchus kaupii]